MWKFSLVLWALFLGLLLFGWKLMLLFAFLTVLAGLADYQLLQNRRKKQKEYDQKAQELMEGEEPADYEIVKVSVVSSRPKRTKKKVKETTKKVKKKPSEKKIDAKLADLEQEIDKLAEEVKDVKVDASKAEQLEHLTQKLQDLKTEHQELMKK